MAVLTQVPCERMRRTFRMDTLPSRSRVLRPIGHRSPEPLPGLEREIVVEVAATAAHWDEAFRLVQQNYEAHGYAVPGSGPYRFTPYHALPNTGVLIARERDRVLATMSIFLDSALLGLPTDSIYPAEMDQLRRDGRRLCEGGNLADGGLSQGEFWPVFVALNRLAWQYGLGQGANTVVITSTPRHGLFYRKAMGYVPLGGCRPYSYVQHTLAQGYWLDVPHLKTAVPTMYQRLLGARLPGRSLMPRPMSADLVRYFGCRSSLTTADSVERLLDAVDHGSDLRRWRQ